jgi:Ala-tRNA(Pro) deacylase
MATTPDELFTFLDRLGIIHSTVSHPPLFSVEESRHLRGEIPGVHTKNLFLADRKGNLFLIVAEESAFIELKRLHKILGASGRLSFGKPDSMRTALGVEPGSVTPFSVMNDNENRVTVIIDSALLAHDSLNFHPLRNTMTTRLSRTDLLRFLEVTGHRPQIIDISQSID